MAFANSVSDLIENIANGEKEKSEVISTEDFLHHTKRSNSSAAEIVKEWKEKKKEKENCRRCKVWSIRCENCENKRKRVTYLREAEREKSENDAFEEDDDFEEESNERSEKDEIKQNNEKQIQNEISTDNPKRIACSATVSVLSPSQLKQDDCEDILQELADPHPPKGVAAPDAQEPPVHPDHGDRADVGGSTMVGDQAEPDMP